MDRDERALVRLCLGRDQAACARLVDAHAKMVGTVLWRTTGDAGVVDDLAQEVFLRVFRGLPYFDAKAKLSTWIYTIAHRVAIDHVRQAGRRRVESVTAGEDLEGRGLDETVVADGPDPETAAMQEETRRLVRDGLADLPEKYRVPLTYSAIDGLDHGTIADMLGVPVGTVKTLVFRGKAQLKAWVAGELASRLKQRQVSDAL